MLFQCERQGAGRAPGILGNFHLLVFHTPALRTEQHGERKSPRTRSTSVHSRRASGPGGTAASARRTGATEQRQGTGRGDLRVQEAGEGQRHGVRGYLCQHLKGRFELLACEVVIQQLLVRAARGAAHRDLERRPGTQRRAHARTRRPRRRRRHAGAGAPRHAPRTSS